MPPFSPYGEADEVMQYYEVPAEVPKAVVLDEGGFMKRILVAVFLATAVALPLPAQERHEWFVGVGVGPVRQDRQGNGLLLRDGGFYQIHGGLRWGRHLGARVDLVHASIGRNNGVAFLQGDPAFSLVPCPTAPFGTRGQLDRPPLADSGRRGAWGVLAQRPSAGHQARRSRGACRLWRRISTDIPALGRHGSAVSPAVRRREQPRLADTRKHWLGAALVRPGLL
jgi:hypothetical protein